MRKIRKRTLSLKAARVNAGLNRMNVVESLGISAATLWNWERGATSPSMAMAQRMADMYGVPLDEIAFYAQD